MENRRSDNERERSDSGVHRVEPGDRPLGADIDTEPGFKAERVRSEHVEQREFVRWFRQTFRPVRIFAIPNGEHRSTSVAGRLKVEGVSAGVPDLFIPEWSTWVEMKTRKGRLSGPQYDWLGYLERIGHRVVVGYGLEDAMQKVQRVADAQK
jgi:hypothetical protein